MQSSVTEIGATTSDLVVPQRLRPPRQRSESLARVDLLDRLARAGTPVVALRAGAGYGKTTVLRQWLDTDERPRGWVTLDRTDDDPVVLVRHLARALDGCGVDVTAVEAGLSGPEPQLERIVLPALASALERCEEPFVLVLDDVHVVSGRESLAVLDEVIGLVPDACTVGLAARRFPALRLARRALAGSVTELGQDDLAFSEAESRSVVVGELPGLGEDDVSDLVRFLRGWPAAVHLAVLALRDHPDPQGLLRGMVATDRRVADYLHEEVLDQLDPSVRDFLLRASVLDRLSPAVCDAVLGRDDAAQVLEQVARSGNLFVHGFDLGDQYRLHDLFRDLLLGELRRQDPAAEAQLRRRAAEWFDAHGEADAAVDQAVATGDADFAAHILYRQLFLAMMSGRIGTLGRWLSLFPPDVVRDDGLVALCAGWHALSVGRRGELEHHLERARAASIAEPLPDGTVTQQVAIAALEMTAALDGTEQVARQAGTVLAAGPGGSPWEALAVFFGAIANGLLGNVDLVESLERVEVATRGLPSLHSACAAQLGWALLRSGARERGLTWSDLAAAEVAEHQLDDFTMSAPVHGVASLAAALRGDGERSIAAAARAEACLDGLQRLLSRGRLHARLMLLEAALRRRDPGEAERQLALVDELLAVEVPPMVLRESAELLRAEVERHRRSAGVVALTAAEQRVLEQLPTHRSLVEIGEHLYVSRNTVKTHTMSIYRKLAVSGRSEAVERARQLGLLDGRQRS
jgi:LuxR family maltose regulon positive regulatory protein